MVAKKKYSPRAKKIIIGGIEFKIVFKEMRDFGEMDFDKKIISIRKGLSDEETFDTLMHEANHASLSVSGLTHILDDDNTEEAIVRAMDNLLFPVFKKEYKKLIK
jgi:hypothetical protein